MALAVSAEQLDTVLEDRAHLAERSDVLAVDHPHAVVDEVEAPVAVRAVRAHDHLLAPRDLQALDRRASERGNADLPGHRLVRASLSSSTRTRRSRPKACSSISS